MALCGAKGLTNRLGNILSRFLHIYHPLLKKPVTTFSSRLEARSNEIPSSEVNLFVRAARWAALVAAVLAAWRAVVLFRMPERPALSASPLFWLVVAGALFGATTF